MAGFHTIDELPPDLSGKRALVRVDFNVPMNSGMVSDDTRLRAAIPTIRDLRARNAAVVLLSHFGRPDGKAVPEMSLQPILQPLSQLLGLRVKFCEDLEHPSRCTEKLAAGDVLLLMFGAIATLFATRGVKIKPDPENKPPSDQGGQPMV